MPGRETVGLVSLGACEYFEKCRAQVRLECGDFAKRNNEPRLISSVIIAMYAALVNRAAYGGTLWSR